MALFSFEKKDSGNGNGHGHAAAQELPDLEPVMVSVSQASPAWAPQQPLTPERQQYLMQMRVKIHAKLVERLNVQNLRAMPINVVRQEVRTLIRELYQSEKGLLSSAG